MSIINILEISIGVALGYLVGRIVYDFFEATLENWLENR